MAQNPKILYNMGKPEMMAGFHPKIKRAIFG
jgi:hypothetical protein